MEPPFANSLAPCNFISGDLTVFKPKYLSLQITIYATLLVRQCESLQESRIREVRLRPG